MTDKNPATPRKPRPPKAPESSDKPPDTAPRRARVSKGAAPKDASAPSPRKPRPRKAARPPTAPREDQPEQKLGDTPAPPWAMPTPAEKAAAEPVRDALNEALAEVTSEAAADRVVQNLEAAFGQQTAEKVAPPPPPLQPKAEAKSVAEVAAAVKAAADTAPDGLKPELVIAETTRAIETASGPAREAAAEAVQEVLSPQQQGAPGRLSWRRKLLQQAQLRRLKPLAALDARLYLAINHLPHSRVLNGFFYFITYIFTGGWAWYALLAAAMAAERRPKPKQLRGLLLAMSASTLMVEFPIKYFFRRRRPFIDVVRAVVIGKKPGSWSFPSGHSASAFAGAWVMRQFFPRLTPLFYGIAVLVGFSRIYLGDHYPGDVVSGSILGHLLAMTFGKMLNIRRPRRRWW